MADREQVIKSLKWLIFNFPLQENPKDDGDRMCNAIHVYAENAVKLLEAQEPRALTLDEVKASIGEPIYFESHGTYMGKTGFWILPALFTTHGLMRYVHPQSSHYSELGLHDYGIVWRCWSARPTDEKREATPWEET